MPLTSMQEVSQMKVKYGSPQSGRKRKADENDTDNVLKNGKYLTVSLDLLLTVKWDVFTGVCTTLHVIKTTIANVQTINIHNTWLNVALKQDIFVAPLSETIVTVFYINAI